MAIHKGKDQPKASAPTGVSRAPFTVELPECNADGETIYVRCTALPLLLLQEVLEGIAATPDESGIDKETTIGKALAGFRKALGPMQRVIEAAVIEPRFRFGGEDDGRADFWKLSSENQGALVSAIMEESGLISKGSAASKAASFPEEQQGASDRSAAAEAVPAQDPAA